MKVSALSRTPVEIWRHILQLAIKTRLHGYDADSILEDAKLFDIGCRSWNSFIQSEETRTNLRRVCRSWNEVLKSRGDKLVIANDQAMLPFNEAYKTARRIEFITTITCNCNITGCPMKNWDPVSKGVPDTIPGTAEALIYHAFPYEPILHEWPCYLKVMSWRFERFPRDPESPFGPLHFGLHIPLTHLYLANIRYSSIQRMSHEIVLPQLRSLWMHFRSSKTISDGFVGSLLLWKLPKLERLRIEGECTARLWQDIPQFTTSYASTLRQVIIDINLAWQTRRLEYWTTMVDIRTNLPHLSLFGAPLASFNHGAVSSLPAPPEGSLEVLLVMDFILSQVGVGYHIISIAEMLGVKIVQFYRSWDQIRRQILNQDSEGEYSLRWARDALDLFGEAGILVKDFHGDPLTADIIF